MIRSRTVRQRGWIGFCGCALVLVWSNLLIAQPTGDDVVVEEEVPSVTGLQNKPNSVKIVEPRMVLLKDKDGHLVPFLNVPLEEIQRLYDLEKGLLRQNIPPQFGLEQIEIDGIAEKGHVLLDIKVHIVVHDKNWVRIPLGLNDGHLREPLKTDKGVEAYVMVDSDSAGHICFVKSRPDQKTVLRLRMSYRTEHIGRETRLSLNIARSSLTELTLRIPGRRVVATVSDEATLRPVEPLPDGGTQIHAVDIAGQLHLAWREGLLETARDATFLEAKGAILVNVVGPSNIHSQARIQLRSFGKPVELVRVELPPGSQLLPSPQPGYTVETVGDRQDPPASDVRQAVDIKFERPTTSPPEIQLNTEHVLESDRQEAQIEVSGFRVVNAFHQSGYIALAADSESYPRWSVGPSVRRINSLPESLQQESVLASFEYFRQPCSLKVRIEPRESRVTIEPFHTLLVEAERLRLETRLDVTVRGAKTSFIDVEMQDWVVEDVEPAELVNKTALVLEQTSPLTIRLKQPSTGNLQLVVRAVRPLKPAEENYFEVNLPRAQSQGLRAAKLAVIPDDNIALSPRSQELQGWNVVAASSFPEDFSDRQQEPFFYRESTTSSPAVFGAEYVVRKRSVLMILHSNVVIRDEEIRVQQRIEYNVRHEPIEQLPVLLPALLMEEANIKYHVEGEPADPIVIADRANGPDNEPQADKQVPRRILIPLSRPRSGKVVLTLEFSMAIPVMALGTSDIFSIPFALPSGGNVTKHTLDVAPHLPLMATVEDAFWVRREEATAASTDQGVTHWTSNGESPIVSLAVNRPARGKGETVVVDLAWVQTWLSHDQRQDRATFRLTTANLTIPLRVPAEVQNGNVEVFVNGQPAIKSWAGDSTVTVDLVSSGAPANNHYLLEVFYQMPAGRPVQGNMYIETPRIAGQSWTRQSYWQLITPRDEWLLSNPRWLTPEFNWAWPMLFSWRSNNVIERMEKQFETFVHQPGPAAQGTNQYLFSTLSALPAIQVRTADQKIVLLVVASIVLGFGLLLIYFSPLQHPFVLLLFAVAILGVGQRFPETSILIAQVSMLGVVLILFHRFLQWLLLRRKRHDGVVHGTTSSSIERLTIGIGHAQSSREESRVLQEVTVSNPSSVSRPQL